MFRWLARSVGRRLASYLMEPVAQYERFAASSETELHTLLQPGDILLVEGNLRLSAAIKYLTQSTWSHACLYIGDVLPRNADGEVLELIEADMNLGVIAIPVSKYQHLNTRICRPLGINASDMSRLIEFAINQIGHQYDLKNLFDIARYLFPIPIPARYRRRALAFGSGDPSRAICSTLIAQAFQSIDYPILPRRAARRQNAAPLAEQDILLARHYSHFTSRDFDLSPYFAIIKPAIEQRFDYKQLKWEKEVLEYKAKHKAH